MQPSSAAKIISRIFSTFLLASTVLAAPARAQTFTVLHTFTGAPKDGEAPVGELVRDAAGNLCGVTSLGGSATCGQFTCGTVFILNKTGKELGVFSFNGKDGANPGAGLLRDSTGNLYGTTELGGAYSCGTDSGGCGALFQLNKTGNEIRNYSFAGRPDDGDDPDSGLIEFSRSLYGTTEYGGVDGFGTVYKINTRGKETVLYSFRDESDGCSPSGVTSDSNGNLYGVTFDGGFGGSCNSAYGTAYELDTEGNLTVLYTFGGAVGANPDSRLIFDPEGNLYGTAGNGGSSEGCGFSGCGTVFELSPQKDGTWSGSALYSFCSLSECADGEEPVGSLARDAAGNLYGTTYWGGTHRNCNGEGCGTVFKIDTSGNETVLYSFTGGSDGANPGGGLIMDASGNLYGVTVVGGDTSCAAPLGGCGVVFELTP